MEDTLITFETAKLAKEKNFNERCRTQFTQYHRDFDRYKKDEIERHNNFIYNDRCYSSESNTNYACPTQSVLQKWLREKHNVHIEVIWDVIDSKLIWFASISFIGDTENKCKDLEYCDNFELALEKGLFNALKLVA